MAKKNGNYLFPDTEKVGGVIFHYSKRLNGSFVAEAKKNLDVAVAKLRRYKNVNLKSIMEVNPIHVYIYPDIKSFRQAMGYEMQKMETRQMHGLASKSIETRYILRDEAGSIHVVLPQGRSDTTFTTFSSEVISMIVTDYIDLDEKQAYELKNTIKRYIKSEKEKEEKKLKAEEEENLEQEEQEEKERQELEEQEAKEEEERLQAELEEMEQDEREQAILSLDEISEEEIEEIISTQAEIEEQVEVPGWLVYGWKAYVCNRLQNSKNIEKFKKMMEKGKTSKATNLKSAEPSSEKDLNVAASAVEYIICTYGYNSYIRLCKEPDNIKGIFYKSTTLKEAEAKEKFNSEVKAYIAQVLGRCNIVEAVEIEQDEVIRHIEIERDDKTVIEKPIRV